MHYIYLIILGVIGALKDVEDRLVPDLEFSEKWYQFCRVAVAAVKPVPKTIGYLERLLEKWTSASGHGNINNVEYTKGTLTNIRKFQLSRRSSTRSARSESSRPRRTASPRNGPAPSPASSR